MIEDLDRLLSSEDPLVPSSGFAARVMDAVHETETRAVAATPFPWMRFVVGALASAVCAGAAAVMLENFLAGPMPSAFADLAAPLGMAALALLASLAPVYGRRLLPEK